MLQAVVPDSVAPLVNDYGDFLITDFLGDHKDPALPAGFQAYLVEQRAPELRPHFHEVDQFQVVVGGDGTLGRDQISNGAVHYTEGYTSYGPIRTEEPLAYFTLRAEPTTGINYMPEERRKRAEAGGGGEHFTAQVAVGQPTGGQLELIARSPRGAVAYACHLAADVALTSAQTSELAAERGYVVVLDGVAQLAEQVLPARSILAFSQPSEVAGLSAAASSEGGASVALMTFAPAR
ncbi:hypothetical protein [Nocardioides alcanivorans]|uniref:hypothetical protein n=1 Tax=Nocardioides alcanivorans TaxID=2897352 RepID=UPI001F25AEAE|nr:hypothetical protein [Nocardioides alcanivorans]